MLYIVICISCGSCGKRSVGIFDHEPSEKEKIEVAEEIGGMWCIETSIIEIEMNEVAHF